MKTNDWISIEDKLPRFNEWVLICFSKYKLLYLARLTKYANKNYWHIKSYYDPQGIKLVTVADVTHWMPLPNLPEIKNETD